MPGRGNQNLKFIGFFSACALQPSRRVPFTSFYFPVSTFGSWQPGDYPLRLD